MSDTGGLNRRMAMDLRRQLIASIDPYVQMKVRILALAMLSYLYNTTTGEFTKASDGLSTAARESIRLLDERIDSIIAIHKVPGVFVGEGCDD